MTNDIRTKTVAFLSATKSALAYNSKPGFQALMKTFGLPAQPWIPAELESLKVIEVVGEKASCAKEWKWLSKNTPDQIFDELVLYRRAKEAPAVPPGVDVNAINAIAKAAAKTVAEGYVGMYVAQVNGLVADLFGKAADRERMLGDIKGFGGESIVGEILAMHRGSIADAQRLNRIERALEGASRPPAAELLEMAINDLSQISQRLGVLEGNVTSLMRQVFQNVGVPVVKEVPAKPVAVAPVVARKPFRIGVLGPWQRDWRYVIENVTYPEEVLVLIDRDVRPIRVQKGFDYVVIASDCTVSASEFRAVYGERAMVSPAGGMKRLAAFINEVIARHDKRAEVAA